MDLVEHKKQVRKIYSPIPASILEDPLLNELIAVFPPNYNFEFHKCIWRIEELKKELGRNLTLVLQLPQGLQMFSCMLADFFEKYSRCDVFIVADENYGACCIEDFGASLVDADFIIHYGHSCLVPITQTIVKALYVFVDILFDVEHLVQTIAANFPDKSQHLYLMSVIQFNSCLYLTKEKLSEIGYTNLTIPQEKPRAGGETLGCTAPNLDDRDDKRTVIFIADGRFHLEGSMIQNPKHTYYQYNPYEQILTLEKYDYAQMTKIRREQIFKVPITQVKNVGIILGMLGRQGNPLILERMVQKVAGRFRFFVILISEIFPHQLKMFGDFFDFFVQIACPRLSIDWGTAFHKPLLNSFEFWCYLNESMPEKYANDFYSENGGEWSNYYGQQKPRKKKIEVNLEATA